MLIRFWSVCIHGERLFCNFLCDMCTALCIELEVSTDVMRRSLLILDFTYAHCLPAMTRILAIVFFLVKYTDNMCARISLALVLSGESICEPFQLCGNRQRHFTSIRFLLFCQMLLACRLSENFKQRESQKW